MRHAMRALARCALTAACPNTSMPRSSLAISRIVHDSSDESLMIRPLEPIVRDGSPCSGRDVTLRREFCVASRLATAQAPRLAV
jgi:hypothetical protein